MKKSTGSCLLAAFLAASVCNAEEPSSKIVSSVQPAGVLDISMMNEAHAAVKRGLDWLAANQNPDGSWSNTNFPALTAIALWPFLYSDHPDKDKIIDKAVVFLKSFARENGGLYRDLPGKGGGLANYNTAICMTVLHATGRPDTLKIVQDARKFIASAQYFGDDEYKGGFGYDKDTQRAYTDMLNTYYSAEAMAFTQSVEDKRDPSEKKVDLNWAELAKFAEKNQSKAESGPDNAGGFVYNPADPKAGTLTNEAGKVYFRSYGSITYSGLLTLMYAKLPKDDPRIVSAMDWAMKHWSLEENPGMGEQGLLFFYNVLTKCLHTMGRDEITKKDGKTLAWRQEVAQKLISTQKTDPKTGTGYWENPNNRFWEGDTVLATGYMTLALQIASGAGQAPTAK